MKKKPISLKWGLITTIVVCWIVPVLIIAIVAGLLLNVSYRKAVQQEMTTGAQAAIRQVEMHLSDAITASKAVSYDNVVSREYAAWQESGDGLALHNSITDYLNLSFAWDDNIQAVFIEFTDETTGASPKYIRPGLKNTAILNHYRDCRGRIEEKLAATDTEVLFLLLDGELYMVRNLISYRLDSYARIVVLLDKDTVFGSMQFLPLAEDVLITLDDCRFRLSNGFVLSSATATPEAQDVTVDFSGEVDSHKITFTASTIKFDLWKDTPSVRLAVAGVALLVLPLLAVVILLFYRHITRPIEALAQANQRVQSGERGYQIQDRPANTEFLRLYHNFNDMSAELEKQFQRAHQEQQATQRAKIKALQSQINPHFLNNTLEIINWEARLAENDRVCAMIEALSTMLDAALDRNGRAMVTLREEMTYVDAYLYIIRQRLGEGFRTTEEIDPATLEQSVPILLLQPIVENAVEHDITPNRGGSLCVRSRREGERVVMEVTHDGSISREDQRRIESLLTAPAGEEPAQVGLQNVYHRLRLIYGENASLTISEATPGTVVARVSVPYLPYAGKDSKNGQ